MRFVQPKARPKLRHVASSLIVGMALAAPLWVAAQFIPPLSVIVFMSIVVGIPAVLVVAVTLISREGW